MRMISREEWGLSHTKRHRLFQTSLLNSTSQNCQKAIKRQFGYRNTSLKERPRGKNDRDVRSIAIGQARQGQ